MNTTTKTAVDALGTKAAEYAMLGAAEYINQKGLRGSVDVDALIAALKRTAPAAADQALLDAREAFECGMTQVAMATFAATMKLVGIKAAQEVCA